MIPQQDGQLSHCRLLLAGDEREGSFGKAKVLLEVLE
jgi:hypothetical protein